MAKRSVSVWALAGAIGFGMTAAQAAYNGVWERQADVENRPAGPGTRGWGDMVYDSVRERLVVVGGSSSTYLNDIFSYHASTDAWTQIEPVVDCDHTLKQPPTRRDEHSVEYDSFNDLYWSFGGSGFGCSGPSLSADAGSDTATVVDAGLPSSEENYYYGWTVFAHGKSAYVESYNAASKTLTLMTPISGLGPGSSYRIYTQRGGGTYHYSPSAAQWTGFEAPYWGYTGPVPANRLSPTFAYSPVDQALVMFGGKASYRDTWVMDVQTQTWIRMNGIYADSAPPARTQVQHAMAYDPVHQKFVLFGGECRDSRCGYGVPINDLWTYDLATNTWTELHPPVSPAPRLQHNFVYDPDLQVFVMYAGRDYSRAFNDLWVYDLGTNTWTEVSTATAPTARSLTMLNYDRVTKRFVLYGGTGNSTRDVWHLTLSRSGGGNAAPVPVIDIEPRSGDVNTVFNFDGSGSSDNEGPITRYDWDFGDSSTASGASVTHQYASPGEYTVQLTVVDGQGASNSTNALVSVAAVDAATVVDNLDANTQRTGTWYVSSGANPWSSNSLYNNGGSVFRWTPNIADAGAYRVYAWWTYHPNRSTSVPYRVTHADGTDTILVNQLNSSLAGQWQLLGTYNFNSGHAGYVEVSSENGQASADAIRLERSDSPPPPPGPAEVIMDNRSLGTSRTGTWYTSSGPNPWAADSLYNNSNSTFRWTPTLGSAGTYEVYVWWTYHPNRSANVPYRVRHAGGVSTVTVNQLDSSQSSQWVRLGSFELDPATAYVEVSSENGQACADAVRIVASP